MHGATAPDTNDEYLFYQTLIGAWPADPMGASEMGSFRERIAAYMLKATREAKVYTSWINPDEEYDGAVQRFVQEVLTETNRNRFLKDFQTFQRRVAAYGWINALAQLLLKLTCPGVPDIYQGSELWNLSLVDPIIGGQLTMITAGLSWMTLSSDFELLARILHRFLTTPQRP